MPRVNRAATRDVRVMFDDATYQMLREASLKRHEPVAAIIRRAVSRMLRQEAADDGAQVLAEAVRGVLREELQPVRRLAFLGAFESSHGVELARRFQRQDLFTRMTAGGSQRPTQEVMQSIANSIATADAEARRWAAQRTRDPEPADPADEAPPAPLPSDDAIGAD